MPFVVDHGRVPVSCECISCFGDENGAQRAAAAQTHQRGKDKKEVPLETGYDYIAHMSQKISQ